MMTDAPARDKYDVSLYFNDDNTFSQSEAPDVVAEFVCPVCYADLAIAYIPNYERVMIHCPEHGNVCDVGRITRNTVSIESERSFKSYHEVIRNLPDLWGDLIVEGLDYHKAVALQHSHVCSVCGQTLLMWEHKGDKLVDLECAVHNKRRYTKAAPFVKRDQFVFNFQSIRDWEKTNKRSK